MIEFFPVKKASKILRLDSVDSTNEEAKRRVRASGGDIAGLEKIIIAREQVRGKGSLGRSFFSPRGDSLYASFIFEAPQDMAEVMQITRRMADAVFGATQATLGKLPELRVKPVNDILLGGKKVCGILTESLDPAGSGRPTVIVVGIGVNLNLKAASIPSELKDKIGTLEMDGETLRRFERNLIKYVEEEYGKL